MLGASIGIAQKFFCHSVEEVKRSHQDKVTTVPKWLGFTGVSYTHEGFLNKPHLDLRDHKAGGMVVWMLHQQGDFPRESYPTFFLDGLKACFQPQHGDLMWLLTKEVTHGTLQGQGEKLAPLLGIGLYSNPVAAKYHSKAVQNSFTLVDTLLVKTYLRRKHVMDGHYEEAVQMAGQQKKEQEASRQALPGKAAKRKMNA